MSTKLGNVLQQKQTRHSHWFRYQPATSHKNEGRGSSKKSANANIFNATLNSSHDDIELTLIYSNVCQNIMHRGLWESNVHWNTYIAGNVNA